MVYRWKDGSRFRVSAQVAGEELERIKAEGPLTPRAVVDASRPADAPLHRAFTWDDREAAEKCRDQEARQVIHSVQVVHQNEQGEDVPVLGYVSLEMPEVGRCYVTTAEVVGDAELHERALDDALRTLEGWRRRCDHIKELAEVLADVDRALGKLRRRAAAARKSRRPQPAAMA